MLNIPKMHMICIVFWRFCLREWKLTNVASLYAIFCSYKMIKTSIKSWANIKESSWSNPI